MSLFTWTDQKGATDALRLCGGVVGYTFTAVMNAISILIIDLFPAHGGTITGCVRLPP